MRKIYGCAFEVVCVRGWHRRKSADTAIRTMLWGALCCLMLLTRCMWASSVIDSQVPKVCLRVSRSLLCGSAKVGCTTAVHVGRFARKHPVTTTLVVMAGCLAVPEGRTFVKRQALALGCYACSGAKALLLHAFNGIVGNVGERFDGVGRALGQQRGILDCHTRELQELRDNLNAVRDDTSFLRVQTEGIGNQLLAIDRRGIEISESVNDLNRRFQEFSSQQDKIDTSGRLDAIAHEQAELKGLVNAHHAELVTLCLASRELSRYDTRRRNLGRPSPE